MFATVSNTVCRTCLASEAQNPIFENSENNIELKLFTCLHEKVDDIEGYPRNICDKCNEQLTVACDFINSYKVTCKVLQCDLIVKKEKLFDNDHTEDNVYDRVGINDSDEKDVKPKIEPPDAFELKCLPEFESVILDSKTKNLTKTNKTSCKPHILTTVKKTAPAVAKKGKQVPTHNETRISFVGGTVCSSKALPSHAKLKDPNSQQKPKRTRKIDLDTQTDQKNTEEQKEIGSFLCDLCGQLFKSKEMVRRHMKLKHLNNSKFKCPECPLVFVDMSYLKRHQKRKHSTNKAHSCPICGNKYVYLGEMNTHIKAQHSEVKRPRKDYACSMCSKKFACQRSVTVHERSVHTGERPELCPECGAAFTHIDYLRDHMRLHTGETPFKCPVCGRGYAQLCNMKSHIRQHKISELDADALSKVKPQFLRFMKP